MLVSQNSRLKLTQKSCKPNIIVKGKFLDFTQWSVNRATARHQLEIELLEPPVDRAQIDSYATLEVDRSIDRAKKN